MPPGYCYRKFRFSGRTGFPIKLSFCMISLSTLAGTLAKESFRKPITMYNLSDDYGCTQLTVVITQVLYD